MRACSKGTNTVGSRQMTAEHHFRFGSITIQIQPFMRIYDIPEPT